MKRTCLTICFLVGTLLLADSADGSQIIGDGLGSEWNVTEAGITGRWVRRGNTETWDGNWANGAVAILSISIAGDKVKISRKDVGGPSTGLTAIYEGTLAPDGTIKGIETVTSPGHSTQNWQGRIVKTGQVPRPTQIVGDGLGSEWIVTEAGITGRWVRRGNTETWDGNWANGAVAILSISIAGDKVKISRKDVGGPSTGLTAVYEGTLAPDGTIKGIETVTSPGHSTQNWQGRIVKTQGSANTANAIRYRVENLVYNNPDIYTNPRNWHDFMVDFNNCTVRSLSQQADEGRVLIQVLVCRANRRLTFTSTFEGNAVEYDWTFRDEGRIVGGVWRQGSGFGPSVGGILGSEAGWSVR